MVIRPSERTLHEPRELILRRRNTVIFHREKYRGNKVNCDGREVPLLAIGTRIALVLLAICCPNQSMSAHSSNAELSVMPKILLSMLELQRRALLEVRKQPGCHNVQQIVINHVAKYAENNWSLCVLSAGSADANTAARAAAHVQTFLRRDYDLLTD
jgi:hypothetical protein